MIGQVPSDNPLIPGGLLMLAGRRWKILEIDTQRKELSVRPARGGSPPVFAGEPKLPAEEVVKEMRAVWEDLEMPPYLDSIAKDLLVQARTTYDRLGLRNSSVARHDGQILLFPWVGERKSKALVVALIAAELEPVALGITISLPGHQEGQLLATLTALANGPPPDPKALAALIANKAVDKFDPLLGDDLLTTIWAKDRLDVASLPATAAILLGHPL